MSQTCLVLIVFLATSTVFTGATRAQDGEPSGPSDAVAEAWLSAAVRAEHDYDAGGRYLAMGLYGLLGGFLLVAPPLVANDRADVGPKGAAISMGAGALLLGAAATSALVRDPHRAAHWSALVGSLGGIGMSLALAVSSLESRNFLPELTGREDNGARPDALSSIYGTSLVIASVGLGQLLSGFVVDLALPPESPSVLRGEVASLTPDARYDRIRDFLVRREQRRAWQQYTGAAATILTGGLTIYGAGLSDREGARGFGQLTGLTMIISGIGSLISYWISDSSVSLLDEGVAPQ
jgi:hypothetical protein